MKPHPSFRLPALAAVLLMSLAGAHAQSTPAKDGLNDADRAKRDAEKVFSFIKFSTVKPAAPAPAAAAATSSKPAAPAAPAAAPAARAAASPATQAAALAAVQAAAATNASASPAVAQPASPAAATAATTAATPLTAAATPSGAPLAAPASPGVAAPATAAGVAAATATPPAAAVQPEEPEEVPLKLIAYTPPDMNARVLNALGDRPVVVPVRFKVEMDGRVSAAVALGNAPRPLEQSAVRAVQQWKFDKLPASREVDVEISFKAGD